MSDDDATAQRRTWPGGVQPHGHGVPVPESMVAFLRGSDTVVVSSPGRTPEAVPINRLVALMKGGTAEGFVHVGKTGSGEAMTASFGVLWSYIFDLPDHPGHSPGGSSGPTPPSSPHQQRQGSRGELVLA